MIYLANHALGQTADTTLPCYGNCIGTRGRSCRQPFKPPWIAIWKDDIVAQLATRALLGSHTVELWCGERKVATIKPEV